MIYYLNNLSYLGLFLYTDLFKIGNIRFFLKQGKISQILKRQSDQIFELNHLLYDYRNIHLQTKELLDIFYFKFKYNKELRRTVVRRNI